MPELVVKSVPTEFKVDSKSDPNYYTFSGYASTFGNMDSYGDIIMPGAFKKTLSEKLPKGRIKVLWEHFDPFGMADEENTYEDSVGLWATSKIPKSISTAKDRIALVAEGIVDSMSIGFMIPKGKSEWSDDLETRRIYEINLYEWSAVLFPANELAAVENVTKHAQLHSILESVDKDKVMLWAKTFEGADLGRIDNAIDALTDLKKSVAGGRVLEKDAEPAQVKTPATPRSTDEPPTTEIDPEDLAAIQSFAEEIRQETELLRFGRA